MSKEIKCNYCGAIKTNKRRVMFSSQFQEYLCGNCLKQYKEHPINPLPPNGVIDTDEQGRVICHICGRAYDKLTPHLLYRHNVTKAEYLEKFDLNRCAKLTSLDHRHKLREMVKVQPNLKDVREIGKNTRFKKGKAGLRKNKTTRLQTKLERIGKNTCT